MCAVFAADFKQLQISRELSAKIHDSNDGSISNGLPDCFTSRPFEIDKSHRLPHKLI